MVSRNMPGRKSSNHPQGLKILFLKKVVDTLCVSLYFSSVMLVAASRRGGSLFFWARNGKSGREADFGLISAFFSDKNWLSRPRFPAFLAPFSPILELLAHLILRFFSGWKDSFSGTILRYFSFSYKVLKFGQVRDPAEKKIKITL